MANLLKRVKLWFDKMEERNRTTIPSSKIIEYVNSNRGKRVDCVSASLLQYDAFRRFQGPLYRLATTIAAVLMLSRKRETVNQGESCRESYGTPSTVIVTSSGNYGIIPPSIRCSTGDFVRTDFDRKLLDDELFVYWETTTAEAKSHPYYRYITLYYLSKINWIIREYHPARIITTTEASFACSLITDYCRKHGIVHSCIMHGERLIQPETLFFTVDEFYVWDSAYIELFERMGAEVTNYIIENPWEDGAQKGVESLEKRITFYTQLTTKKELRALFETAKSLEAKGFEVMVRLHPRDTNRVYAEKLLGAVRLENSSEVSILESIDRTRFAVSKYSTVLFQAASRGRVPVIDDITDPFVLEFLKDRSYVLLGKEHSLLSNLMKETE